MSADFTCKVADIGLSREGDAESAYYVSQGGQVPVRWTAMEALKERKYSEASDVWSFGIVVYEVFTTGDTPYKGWPNNKVWMKVKMGYRLPQPKGLPGPIYAKVKQCWAERRGDRPSFGALQTCFREGVHGAALAHEIGRAQRAQGVPLETEAGAHLFHSEDVAEAYQAVRREQLRILAALQRLAGRPGGDVFAGLCAQLQTVVEQLPDEMPQHGYVDLGSVAPAYADDGDVVVPAAAAVCRDHATGRVLRFRSSNVDDVDAASAATVVAERECEDSTTSQAMFARAQQLLRESEAAQERSQSLGEAAAGAMRDVARLRPSMGELPFDHRVINRLEAEARLRSAGMVDGMYLLRHKDGGHVVLSFVEKAQIRHHAAMREAGGFRVGTQVVSVTTCEALMTHWRQRLTLLLRYPLNRNDVVGVLNSVTAESSL